MNPVVLTGLLPVMGMIVRGLLVGRARWLGPDVVRRMSWLVSSSVGRNLCPALILTVVKNLLVLVPVLVGTLGWALGISGVALVVMTVARALPVGANSFLVAQRYGVAQDTVTASVGVPTAVSALTVSLILLLLTDL